MNISIRNILPVAIIAVFAIHSCEENENENETKISSYNSTESHKAGQNCMTCHKSGGSGEGWFTVAGTVYDSTKAATFPNATVRLFTGPEGTGNLIMDIEVDGNGNFYTTESIDFGNGLYTLVEGNLITKHMNSVISTGQCSSCHGVSTDRVWVK
ncbi:MAG: hypothetical protein KAR16_04520 [Bacteroidales bacterium]|nr:hypothetical protein [Bacteroidales bacterium]